MPQSRAKTSNSLILSQESQRASIPCSLDIANSFQIWSTLAGHEEIARDLSQSETENI